jgi:4-hydroxy-tetrahydrodipicolinate synthase
VTEFGGLFSVLATPFDRTGALDLGSLRRLVRFTLDAGASGLVALGVMGEAAYVEDGERERLMAVVVEETAGAVPVVVGASHADTRIAADRAARARSLGADPVMIVVPPTTDRLGEHLEAVAAAAPGADIVLQDYPQLGHPPIDADQLVAAARAVPAVRAVKAEHPPTAAKVAAVHARAPELAQLGGLGGLWSLWELEAGARGCMTGFAMPELLAELTAAAAAGEWERAQALHQRALPALVWEFQPGVEVALRKTMLHARGIIADPRLRAPAPAMAHATVIARRLLAGLGLDAAADIASVR